jgi:hypothetical protein
MPGVVLLTVGLVMMARDEAPVIASALLSAKPLVDSWTLLDTGSSDDTAEVTRRTMDGVPGQVVEAEWEGYGHGRTAALAAARDTADWLLMIDADMTVDAHPDLRTFLDENQHPEVAAWNVQIAEPGLTYRLPLLTRGGIDWAYVGAAHEYLDHAGRPQRNLLGLTLHHNRAEHPGRHEEFLRLLEPGVEAGEPRAVYYSAQALWCLGRDSDAIKMYERRSQMTGTWEEERWHAQYMAARLREDVPALLKAHADRPHRPEPLAHAARLIRQQGSDDVLFLETADTHERMGSCR